MAPEDWHPADLCCPRCGSEQICPLNDNGDTWICELCFVTWIWEDDV